MSFFNTQPTFAPKFIEAAILEQFRQQATGKQLLSVNNVDSYVIETTMEGETKGGFQFVDRDTGVPEMIQQTFKKATRSTKAWDASIKLMVADVKVRPDLVAYRTRSAGNDWAAFDDKYVYDTLLAGAGIIEEDLTPWAQEEADPVVDISKMNALIGTETKGNYHADTLVMNNMAWHYLAVSTKLINQDYAPNGGTAYTFTGRIPPVLGMRIIVTEAVGNDVLLLKSLDCGKWDSFLPPTTFTYEGKDVRQPLVHSYHDMYEWGMPSVTQPKLIAKLVGVSAPPSSP